MSEKDKQIAAFFKVPEHLRTIPEVELRRRLLRDITHEREQQDFRWGGMSHDKKHTSSEWGKYIRKHLERWEEETGNDQRYAIIRVAALALAALESFDSDGNCKN